MIEFKEVVVVLSRHFFPAKHRKSEIKISMVETEIRGLAVCQSQSGLFSAPADFSSPPSTHYLM
jgi:hypothetical protein